MRGNGERRRTRFHWTQALLYLPLFYAYAGSVFTGHKHCYASAYSYAYIGPVFTGHENFDNNKKIES